MRLEPFNINISKQETDDLRNRVRTTRFPDRGPDSEESSPWFMGTPLEFAKKLQAHWLTKYDWSKHEEMMKSMGTHYKAYMGPEFDSLGIHFVQVKPKVQRVRMPLLLLHGWPGCFWEFREAAVKLRDAGFLCIIPSLPGYGFSDPPQKQGYTTYKFAQMFDYLMQELGFDEYFAQGGDWGSIICSLLGSEERFGCKALHLNMHMCMPPEEPVELTEEDNRRLVRLQKFRTEGSGYQKIQGTRPQSLGYALNDSPMGLACYIGEKYYGWSDGKSLNDSEISIPYDDLLTIISIYWFSQSITSSMRLYYETMGLGKDALLQFPRVTVPCCIAEFPKEVLQMPRSWISKSYNVERFVSFKRGGHFAALECPQEFADSVISFFMSPTVDSRSMI